MFIDTHAHLYFEEIKSQLEQVIQRAFDIGVKYIICVGTDLVSSQESIDIANTYPNIFATVGIHPHDAIDAPRDYLEQLKELASHPKVVAIGEIGLDFYRNLSPPNIQIKRFQQQLQLAKELDMPTVIHNREADEKICEFIKNVEGSRGVIHCFSSDVIMAKTVSNLGFLISFTGMITLGRNHSKSVLKQVPLEKIMLETDCPFLTPAPNQRKINEPANIVHIAKKVAEIKEDSIEHVADITTTTAITFFNLPK